MMIEQPPLDTGKDVLFLLTGLWDDATGDGPWLCADCCTMEGALMVNDHWGDAIQIVRVDHAKPRPMIVDLLDESHQNAPTLILAAKTTEHEATETVSGRRFITDPEAICRQLAACYGGAQPK
jgi:hypothetical protein